MTCPSSSWPASDLAAAVDAVAEDLADSVIAAAAPGPAGPEAALAGHSVALLNRGTPSSLVSPDGGMHIALMRSCSAWPSGVWIDGEKRTVPDGSSFAWQHWSHTFEYALAAGPGDWREAGFPAAGQEYNHDLLTCETDRHGGPAAAVASLCSVLPVDAPGGGLVAGPPAMLAALKPRGNPLASGRPGEPHRDDGVTVRLRDAGGAAAAGAPARVELRLAGGISAAVVTDLCEATEGVPLPVEGGAAVAEVPPAGTLTLAAAGGFRPGGQHSGGQHSGGQHSGGQHSGGQHSGGQHSGGQHGHGWPGDSQPGAGAARVHQVLAARQGPSARGEPAARGAPLPGAGRPARPGERGPGAADRGRRACARFRGGRTRCARRALWCTRRGRSGSRCPDVATRPGISPCAGGPARGRPLLPGRADPGRASARPWRTSRQ